MSYRREVPVQLSQVIAGTGPTSAPAPGHVVSLLGGRRASGLITIRPLPRQPGHLVLSVVTPWPRHARHGVSVSNLGSVYRRPNPWWVEVTRHPCCRAEASLSSNSARVRALTNTLTLVRGHFLRLIDFLPVVRWGISTTSLWSEQAGGLV